MHRVSSPWWGLCQWTSTYLTGDALQLSVFCGPNATAQWNPMVGMVEKTYKVLKRLKFWNLYFHTTVFRLKVSYSWSNTLVLHPLYNSVLQVEKEPVFEELRSDLGLARGVRVVRLIDLHYFLAINLFCVPDGLLETATSEAWSFGQWVLSHVHL